MRVLIVGGTGLISNGIIKHLLARGADITMFNRGKRPRRVSDSVQQINGDRDNLAAFESRFANERFDVVIHMVCFTPDHARSAVRAFSDRCGQFIFCSTVCTYGVKIPPTVLVDETFSQEPISAYGRDKLECERIFREAERVGAFPVTIIRPSHTYGPGNPMIDQLEFDAVAWSRIENDLPVLVADGAMGLWNSTHRDDVGNLFACSAGNAKTFGQNYNATTTRVFTWRDYYREAAAALGKTAQLISMPADWIIAHDPNRFVGLAEIFRFHGAYSSAKAIHDVPEFRCDIDFIDGVRETFEDQKRRGKWKAKPDPLYEGMVEDALKLGITPTPA